MKRYIVLAAILVAIVLIWGCLPPKMTFNLLSKKIVVADPQGFFTVILSVALIARILMNMFKTAAIRQGEADSEKDQFSTKWGRWKTFYISFWSSGGHRNIDDYYLPLIIGILEMFIYPFLILLEQWTFIGILIGSKTAVHWGKWQETRTAYNRFLFGNLLVLTVSFFLMSSFLEVKKDNEIEPITTRSSRPSMLPKGVGSGG